jgi:hypothetical protein
MNYIQDNEVIVKPETETIIKTTKIKKPENVPTPTKG